MMKEWADLTDKKILLFDLDGTLLRSDKTISERTLKVLNKCRKSGILVGVSTSRGEKNSLQFIEKLCPDIVISSGGALVTYKGEYIYKAEFSVEETQNMIALAREICGSDCEITMDTLHEHYWNYKIDPNIADASWGVSIYTDYHDFSQETLKMCVEIFDSEKAQKLSESLSDCDCVKFVDGDWYKFTKKTATKEQTIFKLCEVCDVSVENIIAFGDDLVDIGMLQLCGTGIAMGNALPEVKEIADVVIDTNDNDGIAKWIEENYDF